MRALSVSRLKLVGKYRFAIEEGRKDECMHTMVHAVSQGRIGSRRIKQGILFERPIPTERKNDHANFNDVT